MPAGPGRYRMKDGVRLHFTPSGTVNEAKNMKTGATHTPAEFRQDRKPGRLKRSLQYLRQRLQEPRGMDKVDPPNNITGRRG